MDFGTLLGLAGAATATALTGGTAAPALAGAAEGAAAAGAGATGLGATGAATSGALEAGFGAGSAYGSAAPSGWGAIMEPMASSSTPGMLGSGMSGTANPLAPAGQLAGSAPGMPAPLPMGMTSAPVPGGFPAPAAPALGTGISGTGAFATAPGSPPVQMAGKAGLSLDQAKTLNSMMNKDEGQAPAGPGGATPPVGRGDVKMTALSTPQLTERPSLAQLLYGRR